MRINQIVRIIVLTIAGLLIAVGVLSLIVSWFVFRELRQWSEARPLDIEVDLSQPGEFSDQFILKCPDAVYYELCLVLPSSLCVKSEGEELLAGLEASCSIMDSYGSELPHLRELRLKPAKVTPGKPMLLESIGHLPEDTYTFRLTVSQGAGALSGVEQHLIMTYVVGMGRQLASFMALYGGVIALTVGALLCIIGVILKRRVR